MLEISFAIFVSVRAKNLCRKKDQLQTHTNNKRARVLIKNLTRKNNRASVERCKGIKIHDGWQL
jgi:hypothetical protein